MGHMQASIWISFNVSGASYARLSMRGENATGIQVGKGMAARQSMGFRPAPTWPLACIGAGERQRLRRPQSQAEVIVGPKLCATDDRQRYFRCIEEIPRRDAGKGKKRHQEDVLFEQPLPTTRNAVRVGWDC